MIGKSSIGYLLALAWFACMATPALAQQNYEVMLPYSLGSDAIADVKKTNFISDSTSFYVDGKIHSVTLDRTTYDRAAVNVSRFGANHMLTPKLSLRWFLEVEFTRHTEKSKETPRTDASEDVVITRPRLEFTYRGAGGLEVFGGTSYWYVPAYERTAHSASVNTVSHFSQTNMFVPHIGLVKRGSSFRGGVYYKNGTEATQRVKVDNSLDKDEMSFDQKVYDPTRIAIFFSSDVGDKNRISGEFAAVQASEGGNRTDAGDKISEDYTLARLEAIFGLSQQVRLKTAALYKTLSYADNRNVMLPAISMWAFHNQILMGKDDAYSYLGLAYGQGKDRQSIPEFNADYSMALYAFTAGLSIAF